MISTVDSRYPISLVKIDPLTLELLPLFWYWQLYLTPVKTQLLQYNLTSDLMLLYHSNKIKAETYGRDIKPILFWCR